MRALLRKSSSSLGRFPAESQHTAAGAAATGTAATGTAPAAATGPLSAEEEAAKKSEVWLSSFFYSFFKAAFSFFVFRC